MVEIRETDCVFRVADGDARTPAAIVIEPRAGGWSLHLNLGPERISIEEAVQVTRRLGNVVTSVTMEPNDPLRWVEAPGSETKQ
jgi:hypothetical protein